MTAYRGARPAWASETNTTAPLGVLHDRLDRVLLGEHI